MMLKNSGAEMLGSDAYSLSVPSDLQNAAAKPVKLCGVPLHTIGTQFKTPLTMSYNSDMFSYVDSAHTVYVFSCGDGEPTLKSSLFGCTAEIQALAFSPNGMFLAAASGNEILIFDIESQKVMFRFSHSVSSQCHEGNVSALLFKTNELLISGGYDSDIKAYIMTDKELKQQVKLL